MARSLGSRLAQTAGGSFTTKAAAGRGCGAGCTPGREAGRAARSRRSGATVRGTRRARRHDRTGALRLGGSPNPARKVKSEAEMAKPRNLVRGPKELLPFRFLPLFTLDECPQFLDMALRATQAPADQERAGIGGYLRRDPPRQASEGSGQGFPNPENPLQARESDLHRLPH